MDVEPEPVGAGLAGVWTGASGPYLLTVQLEQDGRGIYCSSWNEKNALGNLKFSAEHLFFQDGTSMFLRQQDGNLIGKAGYTGAQDVHFKSDRSLVEASPYCKSNM